MKKLSSYLYLNDSGIHNKGVFASRRIPKGIFLLEYTGEKVSKEESKRRESETMGNASGENGAVYMFELDETHDIDGNVSWNRAKFVNHCCSPNCEIWSLNKKIWIVSKRNIKKGEEISYNYCFDLENYKAHPCRCGSKNCAGYILDEKYWRGIKNLKD